jgi:ABC-type multidrug transport system fused ATPase/permease subunit
MMTFSGVIPILPQIMRALICAKKVFDVIERKPRIFSKDNSSAVLSLEKGIKFKDITFRYPTQLETSRDIFNKASFEIKAGQSTAIVGPSGSGKSTIVQLLNRYYDVKAGEISFDQTKLTDVNLKSLRETIGYVSQEPVLILGTIRENMLFGNKDATEQEIKNALEMASAGFVETMENGIDTYVGAASVMNLSGGQK